MRRLFIALAALAVILPALHLVAAQWGRSRQEARALELYNERAPIKVPDLDSLMKQPDVQSSGLVLSEPPGARVASREGTALGTCPLLLQPGSYLLTLPGWRAQVDVPLPTSGPVALQPAGFAPLRWPLPALGALCAIAAAILWRRQQYQERQAQERAGVFPGGWIGPYELEDKLGEGAMAEVYRARHRSTGRYRALKILSEASSQDPELRERFLREVGLCSDTLKHPNIVSYYERGEQYGRLWTAMDLVEGGNLAERIASGMSPAEIRQTLLQLCQALDYAHQRQVFHRDLKPENLMMSGTTLRVADFGLARGGHYPRITQTGTTLGTPAYMPPEQVGGDLPPDGRGDLYSVGCILYEMLTGRPPFQGDPIEVIVAHVTEPVPAPSDLQPGLSPELEQIALRLLDKSPEGRYSAAELGEALSALKL